MITLDILPTVCYNGVMVEEPIQERVLMLLVQGAPYQYAANRLGVTVRQIQIWFGSEAVVKRKFADDIPVTWRKPSAKSSTKRAIVKERLANANMVARREGRVKCRTQLEEILKHDHTTCLGCSTPDSDKRLNFTLSHVTGEFYGWCCRSCSAKYHNQGN